MQIRMDEKWRVLFMATYVISDIHGEYERFMELLEEIELKDTDTLYVLGDVLDRGEHPIKVVLKLMEMPNAFCIVGNHEVMALECLRFLCQEITDLAIEEVDAELLDNLVLWKYNGGDATIREFRALDLEMREEVLNFLEDFSLYEELTVGEKQYLLVHGGLGGFTPEKRIEEYSLHDLVWTRPDYQKEYFADTNLVTGHTPTQTIPEMIIPGIFIKISPHCDRLRRMLPGRAAGSNLSGNGGRVLQFGQQWVKDFRRSMMPASEDRDPEPAEQAGRFLKQDMPKHKQESRFGKNERITKALKIAGADMKAAKEKEILDALYYYRYT